MERTDTVVIGAGVVGLAIARDLAQRGHEVMILERADSFGTGTSSHNSEVLHAGIYYPPGSLRAQLCVRGHEMLGDYLQDRGVAHRHCGKLVVAGDPGQIPVLETIRARARACGAGDLELLSRDEALALEPALDCCAALLSPRTGIIDSHGLMLALLADAEAAGALLAVRTSVTGLEPDAGGITVTTRSEDAAFHIRARRVINAAGLGAVALARQVRDLDPRHIPQAWMARGSWFAVPGRAAFSRLIYPVPEPGGLGIHLTLDLGGGMRFGPDVEWIPAEEYRLSPARAPQFAAAIRRYWPAVPAADLVPVACGIRPKIHGPDMPAADFRIDGPATHGVPGLISLFGIESPGLTACLAIAEYVATLVEKGPS